MRALSFLALLLCAGPALAAPQFTTLYAFKGKSDGELPEGLTVSPDGALYGATAGGGSRYDQGMIFKLSPPVGGGTAWTKETLYVFKASQSGRPYSPMIFDQDTGALLGVASGQEGINHKGAFFRLAPPAQAGETWTYSVIHDFAGGSEGLHPNGDLTQDAATGIVYGASAGDQYSETELGSIFAFTPDAPHASWTRTLNYLFSGPDGSFPVGGVVFGPDGLLYGNTWKGGAGFGTIYTFDPATGVLTTLFAPRSAAEAHRLSGRPVFSDDGATMYDTALTDDQSRCKVETLLSCTVVVSMPVDGSAGPSVARKFVGKNTASPSGGLTWNKTHTTLYGVADLGLPNLCKYQGRKYGCGIVFKLVHANGKWKYTLIHAFDGTDGQNPQHIALGGDGSLYGTTGGGGANKEGTVFRIENP